MNDIDDPAARERTRLATLATIADLALDDLPEVARLVLASSADSLSEPVRLGLLVRAYDVAFDAGQEYLAELLDLAISQFTPSPSFVSR